MRRRKSTPTLLARTVPQRAVAVGGLRKRLSGTTLEHQACQVYPVSRREPFQSDRPGEVRRGREWLLIPYAAARGLLQRGAIWRESHAVDDRDAEQVEPETQGPRCQLAEGQAALAEFGSRGALDGATVIEGAEPVGEIEEVIGH